jgi:hypothetical protein
MLFVLGIPFLHVLAIHQTLYKCLLHTAFCHFCCSLPQEIAPVAAHIPGEQPMVAAPVRAPPVELSVSELLALDPFDNMVISLSLCFCCLFCDPLFSFSL